MIFKRKYNHPDTGDVLSFSEQISWKIQGVIRNWYFVIIWTTATAIWWCQPTWFTDTHAYIKWMNLASWLAVTVELIIGIAMIGQTKRDAMILREIRELAREIRKLTRQEAKDIEVIKESLDDDL